MAGGYQSHSDSWVPTGDPAELGTWTGAALCEQGTMWGVWLPQHRTGDKEDPLNPGRTRVDEVGGKMRADRLSWVLAPIDPTCVR